MTRRTRRIGTVMCEPVTTDRTDTRVEALKRDWGERERVRSGAYTPEEPRRLTLTMKKEATDSSILASKSVKKSMDPLPDVETFRASRCKTKSSVKTPRGYSLHCWLPEGGHTPI
ncbi:unnamed protein product, partial [Iphiclides podalirius]